MSAQSLFMGMYEPVSSSGSIEIVNLYTADAGTWALPAPDEPHHCAVVVPRAL